VKILLWPEFAEGGLLKDASSGSSITIGVFDGVHLGHQALIQRIVAAEKDGFLPLVITFRHATRAGVQEIISIDEKIAIFEKMGIKATVLIDFSEDFSRMTGKEFFDKVVEGGRPGLFVIGDDFACGYKAGTKAADFRELARSSSIPCEIVPMVKDENGQRVSSTRIRDALANGNRELAAQLLGRKEI
jgi:riboflavin kinase/FMN adenylyltransferase